MIQITTWVTLNPKGCVEQGGEEVCTLHLVITNLGAVGWLGRSAGGQVNGQTLAVSPEQAGGGEGGGRGRGGWGRLQRGPW